MSQERIWWMTDFSPTIIIFPVKEIVMGVNPQKIDTLLALCANSNQKAAKNSKAAMLFDKFWHFVKILRLYKQTVYDLRSLWIIESSRNVVICKKTSNVLMLRQIRIFCLAKIIRKLYEHACGLFFSRHYSATLWYDVKESFLFREQADALFIGKLLEYYIFLNEVWKIGAQHSMQNLYEEL